MAAEAAAMDEELTKAEESAGLGRFGLKAEEEVVQNEVEGENEVGNMSELNINCTFMYIYVHLCTFMYIYVH